jgi:hypothetical protein
VGRGSDQDDCVQALVSNVFALRAPYGVGYFGDPCSTGPGEFFLYLPLRLSDLYFVVVPSLTVLLGFWVLSLVADRGTAVLLSLTQLVSLLFLELASVGSDLIVIGWLFATATVASREGVRSRRTGLTVAGAAAYTLFAGSRLPLIVIAILSASLLVVVSGRRALLVVVPATVVTAALYAGSYLIAPDEFRPGHLVHKSAHIVRYLSDGRPMPVLVLAVAGVAFGSVLVIHPVVVRLLRRHYYLANLLLVVAPMAAVALWDLLRVDLDPARWEGLHYLFLGVPILLVMVASWLTASRLSEPLGAPLRTSS